MLYRDLTSLEWSRKYPNLRMSTCNISVNEHRSWFWAAARIAVLTSLSASGTANGSGGEAAWQARYEHSSIRRISSLSYKKLYYVEVLSCPDFIIKKHDYLEAWLFSLTLCTEISCFILAWFPSKWFENLHAALCFVQDAGRSVVLFLYGIPSLHHDQTSENGFW